mmetsp:Transcript_142521/g.251493  ORF Transcript_142521/g.251493 Transcript_142521/m.251493 type:complete len:773 (-) Transcript_142521:117-2435(-)
MTATTLAGAAALRRRYSQEGFGSRRCRSVSQGVIGGRTNGWGDGWAPSASRTAGHSRRSGRPMAAMLPPSGQAVSAMALVGPSAQAAARVRSAEREVTWAQRQQKLKEFQRECQRRVAHRKAMDRAAAATAAEASDNVGCAESAADGQAHASSTAAVAQQGPGGLPAAREVGVRGGGLPEALQRCRLVQRSFAGIFEGIRVGLPELDSRAPTPSAGMPLAAFRVIERHAHENLDQLGDPEFPEGSEFLLCLTRTSADIQASIKSLKPGAIVQITYQHDYVGRGGNSQDAVRQEHTVTHLRLIRDAEVRELLSRQTFSAIFEGTKPAKQPLHRLHVAGSESTTLAVFRIIANHEYEQLAEWGDLEHAVGHDFFLCIDEAPEHIQEAVRTLNFGAPVRITYIHEDVDVGGARHAERSVTHFSIVGTTDAVFEQNIESFVVDSASKEQDRVTPSFAGEQVHSVTLEPEAECRNSGNIGVDFQGACSFGQRSRELEQICRSCGNTGVNFCGEPCSCSYGLRKSQEEEAKMRLRNKVREAFTAAALSGQLEVALKQAETVLGNDVKIDAPEQEEETCSVSVAGQIGTNVASALQDILRPSVQQAILRNSPTVRAAEDAAAQERNCPDRDGALDSPAAADAGGRAASVQSKPVAKASEAASKTHARAEPSASSASVGQGSLTAGGEKATRYTSGLLSLLLRAYAKRGRSPPALCACVPLPQGPPPAMVDNHLSQTPAWESYVQRLSSASSHARNCEFWNNLPRLQRQILVLIQEAKEA